MSQKPQKKIDKKVSDDLYQMTIRFFDAFVEFLILHEYYSSLLEKQLMFGTLQPEKESRMEEDTNDDLLDSLFGAFRRFKHFWA